MKYLETKKLSSSNFKRLCGVHRETFSKMVEIVEEHQKTKKLPGRPSKLKIEDKILMTLEYLREYRTYFHIAQDYGINESTAFRIINKIEDILIKSGVFRLPGKKKLVDPDESVETIVIDVTETPIERPKKTEKFLLR